MIIQAIKIVEEPVNAEGNDFLAKMQRRIYLELIILINKIRSDI